LDNPLIATVTSATFESEVILGSATRPVLCDFFADWCQPCRQLAPVLERLAARYAGRVAVVKLDTDADAGVAARFGVKSLPTVVLFRAGQPVEASVGLQPEAALAALVERHLERPADAECAAALALARAGDVDGALATLARLIEAEPGRAPYHAARLDVLIDAGRFDAALHELASLPVGLGGDASLGRRGARLALARAAATTAGHPPARARAAAALLAGDAAAGIDGLLALMRQAPVADAAALLRAAFVLLGEEHPLTGASRRRMAALMH
jgi:putative thioredoxin